MRSSRTLAFTFIMAAALLWPDQAPTARAQEATGPLSREVLALAEQLRGSAPVEEEEEAAPPLQRADPLAPVNALRKARATLRRLAGAGDPPTAQALRTAQESLDQAWARFTAGSPDLSHLRDTAKALHRAQVHLKVAARSRDRSLAAASLSLQADLTGIAQRMAEALLARARSGGVRMALLLPAVQKVELALGLAARGQHDAAAVHLAGAMDLAANTITFDVERYEQNIRDALAGQTVGHAFSTAFKGQLYQGGEWSGLARTAADAPLTNQSPGKEVHVASVSKTLTAIVILRLLEENGLTPDTEVAPYLPSDWALGDGVADLTFRDFMKHESGFAQIDAGNSYAALRTAIATDVGDRSFSYKNANFGLMRVLAAGLMGYDLAQTPFPLTPELLSTAMFLVNAQDLYDGIGVQVDCRRSDPNPTIHYNFPDSGDPGYLEPDRRTTCGGYGWHISSKELAAVLANLRLTENLISNETRGAMEDAFLGYMDPAEYGWIGGDFGVYYMHGGDWLHGSGEAHACAVSFPIQVQTGLVVNSNLGPGTAYQCIILQTAFDNAWVAK